MESKLNYLKLLKKQLNQKRITKKFYKKEIKWIRKNF